MTARVQVALADGVANAEEIQYILADAGIDSTVEAAVDHDPLGNEDMPQKVLVDESQLEAALEAIEATAGLDEPADD
jgi:hypothetical protein